ncbi:MAG: hypothetical protein WA208_02170 [Thermoanaerobaculia bacterium]
MAIPLEIEVDGVRVFGECERDSFDMKVTLVGPVGAEWQRPDTKLYGVATIPIFASQYMTFDDERGDVRAAEMLGFLFLLGRHLTERGLDQLREDWSRCFQPRAERVTADDVESWRKESLRQVRLGLKASNDHQRELGRIRSLQERFSDALDGATDRYFDGMGFGDVSIDLRRRVLHVIDPKVPAEYIDEEEDG